MWPRVKNLPWKKQVQFKLSEIPSRSKIRWALAQDLVSERAQESLDTLMGLYGMLKKASNRWCAPIHCIDSRPAAWLL